MTVIAYDGKTISADKRSVSGSGHISVCSKLVRLHDGSIVGTAGDSCTGEEMIKWIREGCNPETFPKTQLDEDRWSAVMHLTRRGLEVYQMGMLPLKFEGSLYAIGSGRAYAIAAMYCGKTSKEAVEIASLFQNDCGNGVDILEIAQ